MEDLSYLYPPEPEEFDFVKREWRAAVDPNQHISLDPRGHNHSQQSPCVVKNTFIELVTEGQPDMYGESLSMRRRRQTSEPPPNRREPDHYDDYRKQQYERQLQASIAARKRLSAPSVAVSVNSPKSPTQDDKCNIAGGVQLACPPVAQTVIPRVCPSEDSLTSTRQPSSPGLSTRQLSGDVRSTPDEKDFEDFGAYHHMWMQGCLGQHMMHNAGVPLLPGALADSAWACDQDVDEYMLMEGMSSALERTTLAMEEQGAANQTCQAVTRWRAKGPTCRERRRKTCDDPMQWDDGVVTVMVRQIPRRFTQLMFLKEVSQSGFDGLFDFLYLPYDLKKGINVGYGFINFISHAHAKEFRKEFDGSFIDKQTRLRGKPLRVHPASVQGYEANYRHFAHTKTGQKQDPQFSPLFFPKAHEASSIPALWYDAMPDQQYDGSTVAPGFFMTTPVDHTLHEELAQQDHRLGECCPDCGMPHRKDHRFCANCGRPLDSCAANLSGVRPQRTKPPVRPPVGHGRLRCGGEPHCSQEPHDDQESHYAQAAFMSTMPEGQINAWADSGVMESNAFQMATPGPIERKFSRRTLAKLQGPVDAWADPGIMKVNGKATTMTAQSGSQQYWRSLQGPRGP